MRDKPAAPSEVRGVPVRKFQKRLAAWYQANARDLPWRHTQDPYHIWISEIMLQQTRVAAVIPYYERFLRQFPTVQHLAEVSEQELLAAWSGLGYYSRARNLRNAARRIVELGVFPDNYAAIRELAGIGDYTAAAVGSIAFGLPHAAVDGNVIRVTSRVVCEGGDIGNGAVRKKLARVANEFLDRTSPGRHNQAMMELGATVCLPGEPHCERCPVVKLCRAKALGLELQLPLKRKKTEIFRLDRTILVVENQGRLLCWQQPADARKMAGFWELPEQEHLPKAVLGEALGTFRHGITNHVYNFQVFRAESAVVPERFHWLNAVELKDRPMSTIARKVLRLFTLVAYR